MILISVLFLYIYSVTAFVKHTMPIRIAYISSELTEIDTSPVLSENNLAPAFAVRILATSPYIGAKLAMNISLMESHTLFVLIMPQVMYEFESVDAYEALTLSTESTVLAEHGSLVRRGLMDTTLNEAQLVDLGSRGKGCVFLFGSTRATVQARNLVLEDVKNFLWHCPLLTNSVVSSFDIVDLVSGKSVDIE